VSVVIDAACAALVGGLDSPALRELAGASAADPSSDVRELVARSLAELSIPEVGTVAVGHVAAAGGGTARTRYVDVLRLQVVPVPERAGDFQVQVFVNGVEMTAAGAGLGMDPYDLLVPDNRLVAASEPRTVPIARCECGVYGCAATDVTISRDTDRVCWQWLVEVPMSRAACFAAVDYDAEVARVAADHSWETPDRTAGRLVLANADRQRLHGHGLKLSWVGNHHRDPGYFRTALQDGGDYQIFVDVPWLDRGPGELAGEVCAMLARHPHQWPATWHPIEPTLTGPPDIAGRSWQREHL
jgi:hypothetical protein